MSKNSRFSTVFFIGLIYFIIQQIDNHLRQIVDFIFLPFFLPIFFLSHFPGTKQSLNVLMHVPSCKYSQYLEQEHKEMGYNLIFLK